VRSFNHRVKDDIIAQLALPTNTRVFTSSFVRPNLHYEVRYKPIDTNDPFPDILQLLEQIYANRSKRLGNQSAERAKGICGIIYCATRAQCDEVAGMLRNKSIQAESYHAGLKQSERKSILDRWTETKSISEEANAVDVVVYYFQLTLVRRYRSEWVSTRRK
jgi:superfamily II DNA helicase RecQ